MMLNSQKYKKYVLVKCSNDPRVSEDNFYKNEDNTLNGYGRLKQNLNEQNIFIGGEKVFDENAYSPSLILYLDMPNLKDIEINLKVPKILILREPKFNNLNNYDITKHKYFDKILTWKRNLIDGDKYCLIPSNIFNLERKIQSIKKNCICLIATNPVFYPRNSLYLYRKKVSKEFQKKIPHKFDVYGKGWRTKKIFYKNYSIVVPTLNGIRSKGYTSDKLKTLSNYKYNLCFENTNKEEDYVSEKIFDCFLTRTLPIYLGAPNITDLIDEKYYINFRKFNINQIIEILNDDNETKFLTYQTAVKDFETDTELKFYSMENWTSIIKKSILDEIY